MYCVYCSPHDILLQAGNIYIYPKPQWMRLNSQTVGRLTVYCVYRSPHDIILHTGNICISKTIVDDIEWADSRRVDFELCGCIHHTLLYCRLTVFFLSFKATVDEIEWSDGRRVDCALHSCIHHMISCCRLSTVKTTVNDIEWSNSRRVDCEGYRVCTLTD